MTNEEFSNEFDLLYNNIMSNQAPGLDEYEKSVVLTKAQYEVIKSYLNPKGNKVQEGYDDSQKRQVDFSTLTVSKTLDAISEDFKVIDRDESGCYLFPKDAMFVLNEIFKVSNDADKQITLQVISISFEQLQKKMESPFGFPIKRNAWRIITNQSAYKGTVSQLFWHINETPLKYTIRYVKKPHPIILQDLGDLSIEGYSYRSGSIHIKSLYEGYTGTTQEKYTMTKLNALRREGYTFDQVYDKIEGIIRGVEVADKKFWLIGDTTFPSSTDITALYNFKGMFDYKGDFNTSTGLLETQDCELPEELHQEVLQRAVELAKAAYSGNLNEVTSIGNASSTQIGIIPSK